MAPEELVKSADEPQAEAIAVVVAELSPNNLIQEKTEPPAVPVEKPTSSQSQSSSSISRSASGRASRSLKPTAEVKPLGTKPTGVSSRPGVSRSSLSNTTGNGVKPTTSGVKTSRPAALEPQSPPARKKVIRSQTTTKSPKEPPKSAGTAAGVDTKSSTLHRSPEIKNFTAVDSSPTNSKGQNETS